MDNPFKVLKESQLSSVIFIQDYLQLDFDGYIITFYEWPFIIISGIKFEFASNDYRNTLCSLISKKIADVIFVENQMLGINFQSGEQIEISLQNANKELIYFTTPEGEWSSI